MARTKAKIGSIFFVFFVVFEKSYTFDGVSKLHWSFYILTIPKIEIVLPRPSAVGRLRPIVRYPRTNMLNLFRLEM
jgi:hypothetical protein